MRLGIPVRRCSKYSYGFRSVSYTHLAGGGAPFGYESLRGGKKLYVNATEAKAVRRVFEIKQSFPDKMCIRDSP